MKLDEVIGITIILVIFGLVVWGIYSLVRHENAKAAARPMAIEFNGHRYQELGRYKQITIDGIRYIELFEDKK